MMVEHGKDNIRRNSSDGQDRESRLGELSACGGINGTRQIGTNQADSEGNNPTALQPHGDRKGNADLGKILGRLAVLEEKYNEYVGAHQERLKTRLTESQESQAVFNQEVIELRSNIYEILTSD
ncbi:hypothetical protein [Anabaena sp. PCC 7108]|uniref:hypothetical protein n=1 Tax=Anabaena sp. PCC 7108 TaxID=163908 RepID=UPI000366C418|nr:hypothetical protein [Anabaena sp. PCC 7108]